MGKGWKRQNARNHENAPRDRAIWIVANIITRGVSLHEIDDYAVESDAPGCLTVCDSYEGYAEWDETTKDWLDDRRMSIRQNFDSELRVLEWKELEERARNAPESETSTGGHIYFWDDEFRRQNNQAGYFACFHVWHTPTLVRYVDRSEGPFASRNEAISALAAMMLNSSVNRPQLQEAA